MKRVIITVADNMGERTYGYICDELKKRLGCECEFKKVTDNTIIGGFTVNINGDVYDLSMASQLKEIRKYVAL